MSRKLLVVVATAMFCVTAAAAVAQTREKGEWWPNAQWGAGDQAGASNWITPEKVVKAAALVKTGRMIELGHVYERGMPLPEALAAPRATQRNTAATLAEQAFIDTEGPALTARGHTFTPTPEIGAATALEFLGRGRLQAVAEPVRRGGGSAAVLTPRPHR